MSEQTFNYNLTKPEAEDFYDISIFNNNMYTIELILRRFNDEMCRGYESLKEITEIYVDENTPIQTIFFNMQPSYTLNYLVKPSNTNIYPEATLLAVSIKAFEGTLIDQNGNICDNHDSNPVYKNAGYVKCYNPITGSIYSANISQTEAKVTVSRWK